MITNEYVSGRKASEILGVHQRTLYLWDEKKIIDVIRTPGGKRLYNVKKYLSELESNKDKEPSNNEVPKREYNLKKKIKNVLETKAEPKEDDNKSFFSFSENDNKSLFSLSENDNKSLFSEDDNKLIPENDIVNIKLKPLKEVKHRSNEINSNFNEVDIVINKINSLGEQTLNKDYFEPSPITYKRRIDPTKKQNIIFAQNPSKQLIEKYPKHTIFSGDTSLTKFLDLIISNKANQIVIDKSNWNIDSYNMLLYLINKFSDGTIIGENSVTQNNDATSMETFMKMMSSIISNKN
jgi:DNA-binding transcriptional MerR regulator